MLTATEPTSITTYFGDYLHGVFFTFTSAPSENTGTSKVTIDFTCNMRSKLHVYGYTGTTTATTGTYVPDAETTWMDSAAGKTDVFVSYSTALLPLYDSVEKFNSPLAVTVEKYHVYLAWANPDSSGNVSYDGIEAKMYVGIMPSKAAIDIPTNKWTSTTLLQASQPQIRMRFMDNATSKQQFDIHPAAKHTFGDAVEDVIQGGTNDIIIPDKYKPKDDVLAPVYTTSDNLCTERWYLSLTAIACVEIKGQVERYRNTGDTAHDIILDYQNSYKMHAAIGRIAGAGVLQAYSATGDSADETLKFDEQTVDFTEFYTKGALSSVSASGALLAAILYTSAF